MDSEDRTNERLTELREGLLKHHKLLLDSEQAAYEHEVERIASSNQFLNLVLNDPWFAWLRELSQLVVIVDEVQDNKKDAPTAAEADRLVAQARALITPAENGTGFQKKYDEAMQRDPDVVLAHGRVVKMLVGLAAERRT
ncbi:MAG: hypothetical protein M3Y27_12805 [Acidobacteriota bacterium]|nr:hypothetical protein [Acidobacteriota bacterium]